MKLPVVSTSTMLIFVVVVCSAAAAFVGGSVRGTARVEMTPGTAAASPAIATPVPGSPGTPAASDTSAMDAALNYSVD